MQGAQKVSPAKIINKSNYMPTVLNLAIRLDFFVKCQLSSYKIIFRFVS